MRLRILRSARAASLGGATSQLLAPTVFSLRSRLSTAAAVQVPTSFVDNIITAISISRWVTIGQKIYELWDDESVQNHQTVALHQTLRKRSPDVITTICCKSLNNKTKNQYPYQNPSLPRNVSSYSFIAHSCPILIISDPKTKASIQMSSLMPVILSQNKQEWGLWIGFFVHWCLFNATRMSQYAQPCWRDVLVLFTLVELLSCALCTWRRSTHAISWADFPPKHKSAVSSLFLSRPPSPSSVSLKYLQSGLQRLSVSFRYFLFFFTCGEKWGVCLFWKILTKGSESFGTGFQSPDSPALVVLSPYRCWANCNYQWEPTLTHLLSKKGILLFGGILMQWLHTANESYPLYQSTTSALSLLLLLLFYVYNYIQLFIAKCESRILALSSRCNVCVFFGHTSWRFPFLCSRFPSFSFCVVGCAPRSTPPSAYFLTFTHLLSLFIAFSSLSSVFCLFSLFFPSHSYHFLSFFRQASPILLLIIPSNIFLLQKLFPPHFCPWLAPKYKSELWPLGELTKKICGQSWNLAPNCFPSKLPKTKGAIELSSKCHKMGGTIYHQ